MRPLRVVIAPDRFKECLTAERVAAALADGVRRAVPDAECRLLPLADGGPGMADAIVRAVGGAFRHVTVTGPLGEPVAARVGVLAEGRIALIDMAEAAGLELIPPDRRRPLTASTFGVGELIQLALDAGCGSVLLGLGGSATTDGGAGMAAALGYRFLDAAGQPLPPGGGELVRLHRIDAERVDRRLNAVSFEGLADVVNPLFGRAGAAATYGPQKGASEDDIAILDAGLRRLAEVAARDLGTSADTAGLPGTGAAGGLGFGLLAFLGGTLARGIDRVMDLIGLDAALADADLCLTAEGRFDATSRLGKTVGGVAARAARHGVRTIAFAGAVDVPPLPEFLVMPIAAGPCSRDEAFSQAEPWLAAAAERALRIAAVGCRRASGALESVTW